MNVNSISSIFRSYYGTNREMRLESARKNSRNHDVVSADTRALKKALKDLEGLDFEKKDPDNTKKIYNTINAFIDTYNNTVDSSKASASGSVSKRAAQLKEKVKGHEKELEAIGITVKNSGKLSVDKSKLKTATLTRVKMAFGSESGFADDLKGVNKKLDRSVSGEALNGFDSKA